MLVWGFRRQVESAQSGGEACGVSMILGQSGDVVLERVESGGGEDAGLPHAAPQDLARSFRFRDEVGSSEQHGARRRAQALGQAHRHRIETRAEIPDARFELDRRVEDARAVQVR